MESFQNMFDPEQKFDNEDDYDDEVYEKIEAPKYVDLTRPDHFLLPDDRSWFCSRIGESQSSMSFFFICRLLRCDQNHEDVDPDALYKSFVLRVMAARSPNLRLRKALTRQVPSQYMKCPNSAPAKPSKPRVCRFTAMTRVSQKMVDVKVKVRPISKVNLTPNAKPKDYSAAGKALTTPRVKKCIPSSDPFRSVQNPKTTDAMTKSKVVAKTLVFTTPKKNERQKPSLESEIPMTEICDGMKKLEINSQRKKLSQNSGKPLKCTGSRPNKSVTASGLSTSKLNSQKAKGRVKDSVDVKTKGDKPLRPKKSKSTNNAQKLSCQRTHSIANSDMEIEVELRNGSFDFCTASGTSRSNEGNRNEVQSEIVMTVAGVMITAQEEHLPALETSLIGENVQTVSNNDNESLSSSYGKDPPEFQSSNLGGGSLQPQVLNEVGDIDGVKGDEEHRRGLEVKVSEVSEDVLVPRTSNGAGFEGESIHVDDKENALASDDNRISSLNSDSSQRNVLQHVDQENQKKVNGAHGKGLKGNSTVATSGSLGGKYKKAKPTNPKPFRLRTDERGILREANLERRHLSAPLKETKHVLRNPDESTQRKHTNERKVVSHGQHRQEITSQESNQSELDKRRQKIQPHQTRPAYLKTSKLVVEPKTASSSTLRKKKLECMEKATERRECQPTKSQMLRQQPIRPKRGTGLKKTTLSFVASRRLSVIKETMSTISRPRATKSRSKDTSSAAVSSAGRSSSQGKRPVTIPKEPNFHKIHTPKSCTKTVAEVTTPKSCMKTVAEVIHTPKNCTKIVAEANFTTN
ncbi:hypothetical protein IFM89_020258 [Coptis chinensis]|uniref:Uncharacterized protein n=1 Tax=Coptis chinensis TaxID=261450 RepID=A0A835HMA6_9MAGN|nr:hypothetical protein IFM89_020258 [Coptis chinensis]